MTKTDNDTQEIEDPETGGQQEPEDAAPPQESESEEQAEGAPDPRNAEAAKWRHRAKDAANGLDAAKMLLDGYADHVSTLQRQIVGQHVGSQFADPADFLREVDLGDVLGDDGSVDLAQVDAKAQELLKAHPHYAKGRNTPSAVPASLVTSSTPPTVVPGGAKPSWSDVLNEGKKM